MTKRRVGIDTYCHKVYLRRNFAIACIFVFCLTQLSGCSFLGSKFEGIDGAPSVDVDVSKIPNAVPRTEAYHPYGTRDYVVAGRHYHVLKSAKGYVRKGYASWYGTKFHGNETSTQEKFNLYSMTAASPELPLPCYVQVTNLRNGKKVVVRVNDRGPFYSNRILDVSYAAAKKLGFEETGTAPVKIVAIDPETWGKPKHKNKIEHKGTKKHSVNPQDNYLQVGAFSKFENAEKLSHKLEKFTDEPIYIDHTSGMYRVKIGPIDNTAQRNKLKETLENKGFNKVVVAAKGNK